MSTKSNEVTVLFRRCERMLRRKAINEQACELRSRINRVLNQIEKELNQEEKLNQEKKLNQGKELDPEERVKSLLDMVGDVIRDRQTIASREELKKKYAKESADLIHELKELDQEEQNDQEPCDYTILNALRVIELNDGTVFVKNGDGRWYQNSNL